MVIGQPKHVANTSLLSSDFGAVCSLVIRRPRVRPPLGISFATSGDTSSHICNTCHLPTPPNSLQRAVTASCTPLRPACKRLLHFPQRLRALGRLQSPKPQSRALPCCSALPGRARTARARHQRAALPSCHRHWGCARSARARNAPLRQPRLKRTMTPHIFEDGCMCIISVILR